MTRYAKQIDALLSPAERRVFKKLSTPKKIQDYLEALPQHFVTGGEGMLSPRGVLSLKKAHCMEGAVLGAALLAYHGRPPLLIDFQTTSNDEDHVLAVFKERGLWGALSKTNHPVLRWRDPIYKSPRELAMSYAHEYFLWNKKDGKRRGQKTLCAYSKPFDLRKFKLELWLTADSIDWLADPLDSSPHSPIAPISAIRTLRPATKIEINLMQSDEWSRSGKKLF